MSFFSALAGSSIFLFACGGVSPTPIDGGGADATTDGASVDAAGDGPIVSDTSTGDSGGGGCDAGACGSALNCCGSACKNLMNDPRNCGGCGTSCEGNTPMCQNGLCTAATCKPACGPSQQCCDVNKGGPSTGPGCYDGITCPVGCPLCK